MSNTTTDQHHTDLVPGEIIHIGEIPYRYVGGGQIVGGTDPEFARRLRDEERAAGTAGSWEGRKNGT